MSGDLDEEHSIIAEAIGGGQDYPWFDGEAFEVLARWRSELRELREVAATAARDRETLIRSLGLTRKQFNMLCAKGRAPSA